VQGVSVSERLATIVSVDVVGYSRLMGTDELGTHRTLKRHREELIDPAIARHGGRITGTAGDGLLAELPSAVEAVQCCIEIQEAMAARNAGLDADRRMLLRVGVNRSHVIDDGGEIFGDGVNIAVRLDGLAEPGGICISASVFADMVGRIGPAFEDIGEHWVKNIAKPVRVWRWSGGRAPTAVPEGTRDQRLISSGQPSIVVLPFRNLGGDPDEEYFCDGITEDLTLSLSRIRWFLVTARGSAFTYKDREADPATIGRELGVRYLVDGTVRRAGDRVRVNARLLECASGAQVWGDHYDRDLQDLFAVQDEIVDKLTAAIEPEFLRHEQQRAHASQPRDLKHWELLMQARWHFWRTEHKHNEAAKQLLAEALARRPDDVASHVVLAFCHLTDAWCNWRDPVEAAVADACLLARRALELDDSDAWTHFTIGTALSCEGRIADAIAAQRRALELQPHFAAAAGEMARFLSFSGESDEAIRLASRAIAASPRDPHLSLWLRAIAIACFIADRPADAVRWAEKAVEKKPRWFHNHYLLAATQVADGDLDGARASCAEAARLLPDYSMAALKIGHPFTHEEHMNRFVAALRTAGWTG